MNDINEENIEEAYEHMRDNNLLNTSYTLDRLKGIRDLNEFKFTEKEYFILYCLILLNLNDGICYRQINVKLIKEYIQSSGAEIIFSIELKNTINKLYEKLCNQLSNRGGFYKQRVIKVIRKY